MPSYDRFLDDDIKADGTNALLAVIAQPFPRPRSILAALDRSGLRAILSPRVDVGG